MSLRFTLPGRLSFSPLTWRRGTFVTAAGVVVALATLAPGTARADTLPAATGLHTSPGTACPAVTPSTIGDGDLFLYAGVPDSVGTGADATFDVWDTATSATLEDGAVPAPAGGNAVFLLRRADLEAVAGGAITEFSWNVTISDGTNTGPASVTCSFFFDPTHPGNPVITPTSTSYTIGTPATFTFSPDTSGSTTAAYTYELNSGQGGTVSAGPDGSATVTVTPTSGVNVLTVTADSPGGNIGGSARFLFSAATPPSAADGDMTGDGIADLVTVGGTGGVPSGLWVAPGKPAADGTTGSDEIVTPAVNIGASVAVFGGADSSTDFDGAQAVTGRFTDNGAQDYLVYYPSGQNAGEGVIFQGNDHGSLLDPADRSTTTGIDSSTWLYADPHGDIPLQVANGYHADPNDNPSLPDLLTVSGDPTNGYYLEYYQNWGEPGIWGSSVPLTSTATPDGAMDWNDWRIATTEDNSGNLDLFLYRAGTNDLYLWRDFTIDDVSATASYTAYHVSSKWKPGPISTLRADDINGDGTPDLWTVSPEGRVIGWLVSGLGSKPAITAGHSQPLLSS